MNRKILYISACDINRGGVQNLIKSWIDGLSHSNNICFSWYCLGEVKNELFYNEIVSKNVNVICGNLNIYSKNRYVFFMLQINRLMKNIKYDIVHINTGYLIETLISLFVAKKNHVKIIICHSHNVNNKDEPKLIRLFKKELRKLIVKNSSYLLACSSLAADSMYGSAYKNNPKFILLKNGINLEKYNVKRTINSEKLVFCNIGALNDQKNQLFLIDIFNEIYKINKKTELYIAGNGKLKNDLEDKIKSLKLDNCIHLLGEIENIVDLLRRSDALIFPSKFEGLGIVVIEAQAIGIKAFISTAVPEEAAVTNFVKRIPIDYDSAQWASIILENVNIQNHETNGIEALYNAGYDIKSVIQTLKNIYNT